MLREIIIPTGNTYLLKLPEEYIGQSLEVIAFPVNEPRSINKIPKKSMEEIKSFFRKYAVDFSKIEKWNREDLYE